MFHQVIENLNPIYFGINLIFCNIFIQTSRVEAAANAELLHSNIHRVCLQNGKEGYRIVIMCLYSFLESRVDGLFIVPPDTRNLSRVLYQGAP